MDAGFVEKTGRVLLVDTSGPVRQLMSDVVKQLGFKDVQGVGTLRDALDVLEVERVSWILCSLGKGEPVTAMHILKICSEVSALKHVRMSLLIEEDEQFCLPNAFELGLLSWHSKPFTKDTLLGDLKRLVERLEGHGWSDTLTSAEYLREILKLKQLGEEQLQLEEALLALFPGSAAQLINLAEAKFLSGDKAGGKRALSQAKLLDPETATKAAELAKTHDAAGDVDGGAGESDTNLLALGKCLIVDKDDQTTNSVSGFLKEIGATEIEVFHDGEAAIEWCKANAEPSVIFHEWRIPKISGPLLVQKIRQIPFSGVPLVAISSLVTEADAPLLREMGVATLVGKPVAKKEFVQALVHTIQQHRMPTEPKSIELKLRQLVASKDIEGAKKLRNQLKKNKDVPRAKIEQIEAELALAEERLSDAKEHCLTSLKLAGDSILILNLLGKIMMKMRDFETALKCFEKAQQLSPLNIERLCAIAEAQTEMGDHEAADATLDSAKAVDSNNEKIQETEAKVALAQGDTERARSLMKQLDSIEEVVSFMNNRAVALARNNKAPESLELYRQALQSIPENRTDHLSVVRYNLALANIRAGDLEAAVPYLEEVGRSAPRAELKTKALSLKKRLQDAITNGVALVLREKDPNSAGPASSPDKAQSTPPAENSSESKGAGEPETESAEVLAKSEVAASVETTRGDLCCFKVFVTRGKLDEKVIQLLDKRPRFTFRGAIERGESFGADKIMKTA